LRLGGFVRSRRLYGSGASGKWIFAEITCLGAVGIIGSTSRAFHAITPGTWFLNIAIYFSFPEQNTFTTGAKTFGAMLRSPLSPSPGTPVGERQGKPTGI
jgi:hypothetical protein